MKPVLCYLDMPEYQTCERANLLALAAQQAVIQGCSLEVNENSSYTELMNFCSEKLHLSDGCIIDFLAVNMPLSVQEHADKDAEFLNKACETAEEFFKLLWQRYKDTGSSEFIAINSSGNGTIETADICVSFQQYNKPDISEPLEPATLNISIGSSTSSKRLTAAVYPNIDKDGNLQIKGWKME